MMKLKDGYKKLIGTTYTGSSDLILLSDGGNIQYATESTADTIVQRNSNSELRGKLRYDTTSSYLEGRTKAPVANTHGSDLYQPLISSKVLNGSWEIVTYQGLILFSYITDESVNNGNNATTCNLKFPKVTGTVLTNKNAYIGTTAVLTASASQALTGITSVNNVKIQNRFVSSDGSTTVRNMYNVLGDTDADGNLIKNEWWLKPLRGQFYPDQTDLPWITGGYAAGVAFGGGDTKGVMSVRYDQPEIRLAGANHSSLWWVTIKGSHNQTYNLNKQYINRTSSNAVYPFVVANSSDTTGDATLYTDINSGYGYNPSKGEIKAAKFTGKIEWNNINNKPNSFTPAAHNHNSLKYDSDVRGDSTLPSEYKGIFKFVGIKTPEALGLTKTEVGSYASLFGWKGYIDNSGPHSWELISTNQERIYVRSGVGMQNNGVGTEDWNNWKAIAYTTDNFSSNQINTLTGYTKATAKAAITTTDSLNTALGKLEFKTDFIYNDLFGTDNDDIINKWSEIVEFISNVKEGTDITDEFVTRKTDLTITGIKNFNTNYNTTTLEADTPLIISRNGRIDHECVKVSVDDATVLFLHILDEKASNFLFKGLYLDLENNANGANAGSHSVSFNLSNSEASIKIDSNLVLHSGNYTSYKHAYTNLTGSGSTANLAIVSNGVLNGWTLKTLGSRAFDSTDYLPLTGGTLTGNLNFNCTGSVKPGYVTWTGGTHNQRIEIIDSASDKNTFTFLQSTDSGATWSNLCTITADGRVIANKFVTTGGTASQFVKGDGSLDSTTYATSEDISDFVTKSTAQTITGEKTFAGQIVLNSGNSYNKLSSIFTIDENNNSRTAIKGFNHTHALELYDNYRKGRNYATLKGGLDYDAQLILRAYTDANSDNTTASTIIGTGASTFAGLVTASKFIKSGGTSSQFLKADGSVDSNTYATKTSLNSYLPLTGGTVTGLITLGANGYTKTIKWANTDFNSATAIAFMGGKGDWVLRTTYVKDVDGNVLANEETADLRFNRNTLKIGSHFALTSGNYTNYINETNFPGLKKTGTVTSIKVGTTSYSPSSGVVSLPAYPTALKSPNAIKFKNPSGDVVSYDGSSELNLTGGINYAESSKILAPLFNISWSDITTAKAVKLKIVDKLDKIKSGFVTGFIPYQAVTYWNSEDTAFNSGGQYTFTRIGAAYTGSLHGQYLLSSYGSNSLYYVGRYDNKWTDLKRIATFDLIPTKISELTNDSTFIKGSALGGTYQPIYVNAQSEAVVGTSYAKAIKGITRSGNVFTYTCIDGTTGTFNLHDTTYDLTALKQSLQLQATKGWYRIATSPIQVSRCIGDFEIEGTISGWHTVTKLNAAINYEGGPGITVINTAHHSVGVVTLARIVYHSAYDKHYAYLEVYLAYDKAITLTTKLLNGYGWSLIQPVAGSIPEGYKHKTVSLVNNTLTTTGDLMFEVNSGNSPAVIFKRGVYDDDKIDWKLYVDAGIFKIQNTTKDNATFKDVISFGTQGTPGIITSQSITAPELTSNGDIYLKSTGTNPSGSLVFLRGGIEDTAVDWKLQCIGGAFYVYNRHGSSSWNEVLKLSDNNSKKITTAYTIEGNITGTASKLSSTQIVNKSFSLSLSTWTDTGYTFADLATGTYAIQVTSGTNLIASGIMSVYNNLEDTIGDEIPLHVYGTGWRPYLRTYQNKLQISSNDVKGTDRTVTIKIAQIL